MSNRQLDRFGTVQKVQSFYLNKKIKNGELVLKSDVIETQKAMLKHFEKVYRGILTPDNQIKDMAHKNERELESNIKRQIDLVILESAYGEHPLPVVARKLFQDEIKKNIKLDFVSIDEYKNEIIDILETDQDTIRVCLDEITDTCQSKLLIIFLTVCNDISGLPKRDRKAEHEKKQKFIRLKERTAENLKKLGLPYEDVLSKEYDNKELLGSCNYETSLKHYKKMLSANLVNSCNTTKTKAKSISNILEYL